MCRKIEIKNQKFVAQVSELDFVILLCDKPNARKLLDVHLLVIQHHLLVLYGQSKISPPICLSIIFW